MKKILYVATVVKTHIMEFHIPYLKMLKEMGFETAVAAKNDYENPADCNIPYCDKYYDIPFVRNPFRLENFRAYKELKKIIDEGEYDIIHCHTPVGAMLTRLAALEARKKGTKVIYTAHGFHFYKGAPLINWLLFYPVERFLAHMTDVLITINKEDYNRAKTFRAGKIVYVPGVGIDINRFSKYIGNCHEKRIELGLSEDDFILLSVGELITRKNQLIVLEAMGELKKKGILNGIRYVICGGGKLGAELQERALALGISDYVHFLGYRNDVSEIYNASDLFVFMSIQEGLPVALMEAMACGLPTICSNIRGNTDLIENGMNGELVENTATAVADAIVKLKNNQAIRERYALAAVSKIKHFDLTSVEVEMHNIYTDKLEKFNKGGAKPRFLLQTIQCQNLKRELGVPVNATVLLSVGEINKNKNHKIVIEALPSLKNCWYVLCGKGPLMKDHKKLAERLGVGDRFVMTGYRTDVEKFYSMADVFIFPSYREGLPVALMEAMATGLPCLTARNRGTDDLIEIDEMFFDPNDKESLLYTMQYISDFDIHTYLEVNRRHLKDYSLDNTLRMIKELYISFL